MKLPHDSHFILHYKDEVPIFRNDCPYMTQIMHGGVKLNGKGELSMAFCFRVVTKKREYEPISNALVVNNEDLLSMEHHMSTSVSKTAFEDNEMINFQKKDQCFVKSEFEQWKLFADSV